MISSDDIGGVTVDVLAGEWWLGDRNCVRIWKRDLLYEGGGSAWSYVLVVRWRAWVSHDQEGVRRGRRGIFFGERGAPDLVPAVASC